MLLRKKGKVGIGKQIAVFAIMINSMAVPYPHPQLPRALFGYQGSDFVQVSASPQSLS